MVKNGVAVLEPVGNGAATLLATALPYRIAVTVKGTSPLLFHRWDSDSVETKRLSGKNSAAKRTDDIESFVYRVPTRQGSKRLGHIALPGEYVRQSLIGAARYRQDPRSPRKSAMDLYKAGVVALTELCDLGQSDWDFIHRSRVQIQRAAVTRARPAFLPGWEAVCLLEVLTPEYITPADLYETIAIAGRLIGVGDFRPTYGRYAIVRYEVVNGEE